MTAQLREEDLDLNAEDHPDTKSFVCSPDLGENLEGVAELEGEAL